MFSQSFLFSSPDDVQSILSGKLALRYTDPSIDAMKTIASASHNRSLAEFQDVSSSHECLHI